MSLSEVLHHLALIVKGLLQGSCWHSQQAECQVQVSSVKLELRVSK